MSEPLAGTHSAEVREIAQQEVDRFAGLLSYELGLVPMASDLSVSKYDLERCISTARRRFNAGEVTL